MIVEPSTTAEHRAVSEEVNSGGLVSELGLSNQLHRIATYLADTRSHWRR